MSLTRATPPSGDVVTLAALKGHLRIDALVTVDDALLQSFIDAAVDRLDGYSGILGRCLLTQVWEMRLPGWPGRSIALPFPDVTAVALSCTDADGQTVSIDAANYGIVTEAGESDLRFVSGVDLPRLSVAHVEPVSVMITCGYGAASDVPGPIKVAVLRMAEHLFVDGTGDWPADVAKYLAPYKVTGI